ncbi:hypothetical protein VNO77_24706 [Canavalia gladiata]|uniref:Uncharacterized protein n=1 Tax=Canavalia gladiata TaxID=3824 RepID=A0AAN9L7I1_CANGL
MHSLWLANKLSIQIVVVIVVISLMQPVRFHLSLYLSLSLSLPRPLAYPSSSSIRHPPPKPIAFNADRSPSLNLTLHLPRIFPKLSIAYSSLFPPLSSQLSAIASLGFLRGNGFSSYNWYTFVSTSNYNSSSIDSEKTKGKNTYCDGGQELELAFWRLCYAHVIVGPKLPMISLLRSGPCGKVCVAFVGSVFGSVVC